MNRLYKIAVIILENNNPTITKDIANELGVSVKTVRNDLKKLEDVIGKEGLCLIKKTGIGNYIEGPEINKRLFLEDIKKEFDYVEPFSVEGRQNHILNSLFMDGNQITAVRLAAEMYVSTSTVYKDLKHVEEILKPYQLEIIKSNNNILELKGDEKQYRRAVSNLIFQCDDSEDDFDYVRSEVSRIDNSTRRLLDTLMKIDYLVLEKHISKLENKLSFKFTQEAFISLVIHIAIALKRIKSGKDIIITNETLDNLKTTKEFQASSLMANEIGQNFNIKIPEQEVGYITLHVLGSKVGRENLESYNYNLNTVKEMDLAVDLAHKIIYIASDALHTNLKEDTTLLNGLVLHLRPTINRLKYGLPLRNPILEEIKSSYPDIYGVAWMCGKVFKNYFDLDVPESEIGYIALHIGASLERNREKIKILVVCPSGIGTSQLLSARLKRCFKELDIVGIIPSINLKGDIMDKADIIISTVPLHIKIDKPVFQISPLFTSDDVKKVEWIIGKFQKNELSEVSDTICKEVFIRSKSFNNKNEVISELCQSMYKRNYIFRSYEKSILDREKIYSTEVGRGIALPHGMSSDVKNSCISVTVLKHPVKWQQDFVEFVFLVALKEEDLKYAKSIFFNLSGLMDEENFRDQLRSGQKGAMEVLNQLLFKE